MKFVISAELDFLDASNNPITFLPSKDTIKKIDGFMGDVGREITQRLEVQKRRMEVARKKCMDLVFFVIIVLIMLCTVMMCVFSEGVPSSCKRLPMPNYQILLGEISKKS